MSDAPLMTDLMSPIALKCLNNTLSTMILSLSDKYNRPACCAVRRHGNTVIAEADAQISS